MKKDFYLFRSGVAYRLVLIAGPPVPDFQGTGKPIPVQTLHTFIIYASLLLIPPEVQVFK